MNKRLRAARPWTGQAAPAVVLTHPSQDQAQGCRSASRCALWTKGPWQQCALGLLAARGRQAVAPMGLMALLDQPEELQKWPTRPKL